METKLRPKYYLNDKNEFVIENYNSAKTFSSFFPGIAGKLGIPIWLFYVNRGQCVCSMGIQDKDNPIMEFLPANRAYQLTSSQGFRTFLKIKNNSDNSFYEPFQNHFRDRDLNIIQKMIISSSNLKLVEENKSLGLKFNIEFDSIPEDDFGGIIRTLTIENISSSSIEIDGIDGLPLIIPYGLNNDGLKQMRRLMEAFVEVTNHENSAPLFKCKVEPADKPDVVKLQKGNFYIGMEVNGSTTNLTKPIVDPTKIFGSLTDYSFPKYFIDSNIEDLSKDQIFENRLPSAMSAFKATIQPGEKFELMSIIGHISSADRLNELLPIITKNKYLNDNKKLSSQIISTITQKNKIVSSSNELNLYAEQNFLDNVLRGGFPYSFEGANRKSILHLYARKHGDLERDYNFYRVTPTKLSQGNGNYRDINQNRRSDILFNPDVLEKNIEQFYNMIQLDGFNPLVVKETKIVGKDIDSMKLILEKYFQKESLQFVVDLINDPITPGEFVKNVEESSHIINGNIAELMVELLDKCKQIHETDHSEGYWSDHWTYNLDLIDNYLAVYPDKLNHLLFNNHSFTYHDSQFVVVPRSEKYMLWDGKPMQLDSVSHNWEKKEQIENRLSDNNLVRINDENDKVYQTNLIAKIFSLVTIKMASLDPDGVGIELESDKPNWYDALNGLPGLFGSSINETLELKRHITFLLKTLNNTDNENVAIHSALLDLFNGLKDILSADIGDFDYWKSSSWLREQYREKIKFGVSGVDNQLSINKLKLFLELCLKKLDIGIAKATDNGHNIVSSYFRYEVLEYDLVYENDNQKLSNRGLPWIEVKKFKRVDLPLFLEGPVHYLRNLPSQDVAKDLVNNIRKSGLFDKKLNMYKVNASLDSEPMEIGRNRTFSPGWFENESVWLHMEYKYMLEILRNGLYDEFYADFNKVFIPFLNPEQYGRSILENSSFIVSSANPDK